MSDVVQGRLAWIERAVLGLIRPGIVRTVQLDPYRLDLEVGSDQGKPTMSGLLPVLVPSVDLWAPARAGSPALMVAPTGTRYALPLTFGAEHPPATTRDVVRLGDRDTYVELDLAAGKILLKAKDIELVASGIDMKGS